MLNESHVFDSLPAYVLGSLEENEARQVADHITSCYLCRTDLEAFQAVIDQMPFLAPPAMPSGDLKVRLMDQVRGLWERRLYVSQDWRPSKRTFGIGAFIGLALIVILAASNLFLWQRLTNSETLTGPLGMRAVALQNTDAAPGASGFVIISADGNNGVLVVDELPTLDPEREEYQLWLLKDGKTTSANLFSVDESGYRGLRLEAPESLLVYSEVRVTVEPRGGSDRPTGRQVLGGSLFNP